jgi:benzoyl-CoA reductase/2-hydroxyglutaryl-CoA dehydratase subunit BcrC/BadD/HgdB
MSGDRAWAAGLRFACQHPEAAATAWRAGGGQVAGLLGWSAPRELVTAAGMLPVRLSPSRLLGEGIPRNDHDGAYTLPSDEALSRELAPDTARVAAALLSGALDWIDFLVIGRDREDYTRLFYVLRELRRSGAAPGLVPVAFFDLLRLPSRTSAVYNRQRAAELLTVIAGWAGRPVTSSDLKDAVDATRVTAHSFGDIQSLRSRPRPGITGTDALAAAIAAQVLPAGQLRPLLDAALEAGADAAVDSGMSRAGAHDIPEISTYGGAGRVFLAGSAVDDLTVYEDLEDLGLAIAGEDHEWGDDGSEYPRATRDPLDGIVDRYHFAHGGAARAGLRDRVGRTADRVRAARADGVLYLLGPHDDAAGWQLPALREHLGGVPLVPVRLSEPVPRDAAPRAQAQGDQGHAGDGGWPELREAGQRLLAELGAAGGVSGAAEAAHG